MWPGDLTVLSDNLLTTIIGTIGAVVLSVVALAKFATGTAERGYKAAIKQRDQDQQRTAVLLNELATTVHAGTEAAKELTALVRNHNDQTARHQEKVDGVHDRTLDRLPHAGAGG